MTAPGLTAPDRLEFGTQHQCAVGPAIGRRSRRLSYWAVRHGRSTRAGYPRGISTWHTNSDCGLWPPGLSSQAAEGRAYTGGTMSTLSLAWPVDPGALHFGPLGLGGAMPPEACDELLAAQMAELVLPSDVPGEVASQVEKLKALYRAGLFDYDSFTHAERDAYRVLEATLKARLVSHCTTCATGRRPWPWRRVWTSRWSRKNSATPAACSPATPTPASRHAWPKTRPSAPQPWSPDRTARGRYRDGRSPFVLPRPRKADERPSESEERRVQNGCAARDSNPEPAD